MEGNGLTKLHYETERSSVAAIVTSPHLQRNRASENDPGHDTPRCVAIESVLLSDYHRLSRSQRRSKGQRDLGDYSRRH